MELLLDTVDTKTIEGLLPFFPIAGFTGNPSILAKESNDVKETFAQLRKLAGGTRMIHMQATAVKAEGIVEQAKKMQAFFGDHFYVKVPMTAEGLKAVSLCAAAGIHTTVTTIFTPMQALIAGMAGADFVAPYVDRLDNITSDGVSVVRDIVSLLHTQGVKTRVLAASFKNVQQVLSVAEAGAQAATVNGALFEKLIFHPYTDKSLRDFASDWKSKYGDKEITDFL